MKKGNDTDALVELTEPELVYNEHHKKPESKVFSLIWTAIAFYITVSGDRTRLL